RRPVRRELDLELPGHRPASADVHLDGIQRELGDGPGVPLHGPKLAMLAEGEQLDEGLSTAEPRDDLAGRTLGPLVRRRIGLYLAFVLLTLMHRAVRRAQSLESDEPAVGRVALAHPAGVAAAQDGTLRRVPV